MGRSLLYDARWLPEGFPLTDERKAGITFDQVFRHTSGIIPEVQEYVASRAIINDPNWNFAPFTIGRHPDFPQSAPLYYDPGNPSSYTKGSAYSSVAFNHFSLIFRNVTGVEAGSYLRRALLDPIGVGRFAHTSVSGMGDYAWATAGNSYQHLVHESCYADGPTRRRGRCGEQRWAHGGRCQAVCDRRSQRGGRLHLHRYDPPTNTWSTKPSLAAPRSGLGAVEYFSSKIYAIGGRNSTTLLATTEAYDP